MVGGTYKTVFMIDSGADVNVIAENDWENMLSLYESQELVIYDYVTKPNKKVLAFASGDPLTLIASFSTWIETTEMIKPRRFAKFLVVKGGEKSLIGRSTARSLRLLELGEQVNTITVPTTDESDSSEIFPKIPNETVEFDIDPDILPTKNAYYNIPAAFSERAAERLKDMVKKGIIEKVTSAPRWISGMSAVPKGCFDFRLVVNMKGPNKAIRRCYHRMPHLDEIQRKLHGAKWFTKLDLTSAFHHVELGKSSRELTTFMAEDGMYRFTRLVFGVNCAPEKFQQIMERILRGLEGCIIFIDDILIYGKDETELQLRTEGVLEALKNNNLSLNDGKCEFRKRSLIFLGHEVSASGMNINEAKVKAVKLFRIPRSITELKSFLGLASYVSSYIPSFADLTRALWETTSVKPFRWTEEANTAFENTKEAIVNCTTTKGFYSDTDETVLYTDASPFALGAVLSQIDQEGNVRVISFASKTLTKTEKRYPQTQREALGIVWAIEHYHYYLRGRPFTVKTDARGIAYIFDRERVSSKRIISRAEGFALRLGEFNFKIEYVRGNYNIADSPSRLCEGEDEEFTEREGPWEIGTLDGSGQDFELINGQMTLDELRVATSTDDTLQAVLEAIESGEWATTTKPFGSMKEELYQENGLLIKAGTVVIPESKRLKALQIAHTGHPGSTAMRSILRGRVWWPGMDSEAQDFVQSCTSCTLVARQGPPVPMTRTILPSAPWDLVAIDFNGPYVKHGGILIFLLVDCFSRFLVASIVKSTSFIALEAVLEATFSRYGYPKVMKSDNGPPFNGDAYSNYCSSHGIEEIHSTPLYPQQNGTVERYMQLVDKAMQIAEIESKNFRDEVAKTIRAHNSARHRVTQIPPEELMFNRKLRRGLPLASGASIVHDDVKIRERDDSEKHLAKTREDKKRGAKNTKLVVGDTAVIARTNRAKGESRFDPTLWKVVAKHRGDLDLETTDGRTTKRNVTMVKKIFAPIGKLNLTATDGEDNKVSDTPPSSTAQEIRQSGRIRKPPQHYDMYVRMLRGENSE